MDVLTVKIAILLVNNMLSLYIILTYFLIILKLYLKDETTVQTSSGTGTQYKAVAEGQVNGTAILLYSIELQPAGSSLKTLNSQIIKPFTFTILQ